jgi:hypothetical protein
MAGGDRGLQGVRAAAERLGPVQSRQAAPDEQPVPEPAVLVEEQDGLAGWCAVPKFDAGL